MKTRNYLKSIQHYSTRNYYSNDWRRNSNYSDYSNCCSNYCVKNLNSTNFETNYLRNLNDWKTTNCWTARNYSNSTNFEMKTRKNCWNNYSKTSYSTNYLTMKNCVMMTRNYSKITRKKNCYYYFVNYYSMTTNWKNRNSNYSTKKNTNYSKTTNYCEMNCYLMSYFENYSMMNSEMRRNYSNWYY